MSALGALRVRFRNLDFLDQRQVSSKVRERLTRVFETFSKQGLPKSIYPAWWMRHNSTKSWHLGYCADQLSRTLRKRPDNLPRLSAVSLTCLYGENAVAATERQQETLLVVHLFSTECELTHSYKWHDLIADSHSPYTIDQTHFDLLSRAPTI
jgi:hypothetical protein